MDPGGPSFGKVVLCCHLVGTVDLPGGSFSRSTLPSSFWGGGYLFPSFPLFCTWLWWADNSWLNQKCGMSWWSQGLEAGTCGARPGGEGSGFLGVASQPSLIWPLFPQKLAQALPTLAASRNLVFAPELILRNSGNYQRPLPSPPFLPHSTLIPVLWVCFSALLVCPPDCRLAGHRQWASSKASGRACTSGAAAAARWVGCRAGGALGTTGPGAVMLCIWPEAKTLFEYFPF